MGTSHKPLVIACSSEISHWPEIEALKAQKHVIHVMTGEAVIPWAKVDVILSEKARLMNSRLKKYLTIAIDEARKERYPLG